MSLPAATIEVYWLAVGEDLDATVAGWLPSLNETERARAQRFRFARNRREYVAGHALLRRMLADRLGGSPLSLRFGAGRHGRPELAGAATALSFNLTHCDGLVACAVSPAGSVGVDAEPISRRGLTAKLIRHVAAPGEAAQIPAGPGVPQQEVLAALWTAKEAVIKASGLGLSLPLVEFQVDLASNRVTFAQHRPEAAEVWRLWRCAPTDRHRLALALRGGPSEVAVEWRAVAPDFLSS